MLKHKTFVPSFLAEKDKIIPKQHFFDFPQVIHYEICRGSTTTTICNRLRNLRYLPATISSFTRLYSLLCGKFLWQYPEPAVRSMRLWS